MEEPSSNIEKFDIINPPPQNQQNQQNQNPPEEKEGQKRRCSYFPSAYTILICLEFIVFILTYIIPKGKFDTIEYDSDSNRFIISIYNRTATPETKFEEAKQEILDKYGVKIDLVKFTSGDIKRAISIPGSYKKLEDEENANFFDLFTYPILGLINASNVGFVLMMIGGCINLLIEMNALTSGMEALGRVTKGHEIILLIVVFILISIGGTTFGMAEEILSFYPVLMPIFIKSGLDGGLAGASLYFGSVAGTMFSIVNPFAVGIGSDSAGISFIDGIVLRVIGFVLVDALVIAYFLFYNRRVKNDPLKSAVYDIREELIEKFGKDKKEQSEENAVEVTDEEAILQKALEGGIRSQFTIIQKISLILFGLAFVLLIIGVSALGWWFEQLAAIFLFLGIILIFMAQKGEVKGIQIFTKGAGDFAGIIIIIGVARGINITLDQGLIGDTILNGLTYLVDGLPKVLFAVIMFIVFIILGLFIQSSSGLAVLSMPVFAPLADKVNCSRAVIVNAYMLGQNWISLITPTGLTLIVLQLVGMKYTHWFKFIWMFVIALFIYCLIIIILSSLVD
jgi:uncharacterized ion transporter superfamily protein YfcC